jgi:methionyl-tRNA synthetase
LEYLTFPALSTVEGNELVVTWGNLANRMLGCAYNRFDGRIPHPGDPSSPSAKGPAIADRKLLDRVESGFQVVGDLLAACKFRAALGETRMTALTKRSFISRPRNG